MLHFLLRYSMFSCTKPTLYINYVVQLDYTKWHVCRYKMAWGRPYTSLKYATNIVLTCGIYILVLIPRGFKNYNNLYRTFFLMLLSIIYLTKFDDLIPASKLVAVSVWHIPVAVCTVLDSWWWMEKPSKIGTVLFQNK